MTRQFHREFNSEGIPKVKLNAAIREIISGLGQPLGHKLHKKRMGGAGTGKRGGYRTICYYRIQELIIFIYLYSKSKKETINIREMNQLILLSREYDNLNEAKIEQLKKLNIFLEYIPEENPGGVHE